MTSYLNQQDFGFDSLVNSASILDMLKHTPYFYKENKKIKLECVLVLRKDEREYIISMPKITDATISYDFYLQLKEIILDGDQLVLSHPVSGLCLMIAHYGSLNQAIDKYNEISKAIGNYKLFGKIESLVVLANDRVIHF